MLLHSAKYLGSFFDGKAPNERLFESPFEGPKWFVVSGLANLDQSIFGQSILRTTDGFGAAGVSHDNPRTPNVQISGSRRFKHHQNSTRRHPKRQKEQNGGGREKSAKFWASLPFGAPPRKMGAQRNPPHPFFSKGMVGPETKTQILATVGQRAGQSRFGQSRP